MEVTRYCARKDLNWATLPSLVPKLALDGAPVFSSTYITINRYPDTVTYDSLDEAINDVKKHGAPSNYTIRMYGQSGTRSLYISSGEGYLYLSLDHAVDPAEIDDVTEYLGLIPSEPRTLPPGRPRTAFI